MLQHQMRVPLVNDHGSLPAQQAAAAAQHPMLAPRPIDAATTGYGNFLAPDSDLSDPAQAINAPQFYYPTPPVQDPQAWLTQPTEQDGQGRIPSTTVDYSQFQTFQTPPASNEAASQYKQEGLNEADAQYPQPITNQASFPCQDFTSASIPPAADGSTWYKNDETNLDPQGCIIIPLFPSLGANLQRRRNCLLASYTIIISSSNMNSPLRTFIHPHNSSPNRRHKFSMWRTKQRTITMWNPTTVRWIIPRWRASNN